MGFLTGKKTPDNIRRAAINALTKIAADDKAFLLVVRKILIDPKEHESTRGFAAGAIGQSGSTDAAAVADLVDVLSQLPKNSRSEGNGFIWSVSTAISKLKPSKDAIPVLLKYADSDDQVVQKNILTAIGNMGSEAKSAVPALVKLARKPVNRDILKEFVITFGNIGPAATDAISFLVEIRENAERPNVRTQVDIAIKRIKGP
jgi:HEAT repeat protein